MSKAKRKASDASSDASLDASLDAESEPKSAAGPASAADTEGEPLSFEVALEQLEQTVVRLESGEMLLEESLEIFETGVKLSRQCNETLEAAERRIEILVAGRTGADALEEFAFEDDSEQLEDED